MPADGAWPDGATVGLRPRPASQDRTWWLPFTILKHALWDDAAVSNAGLVYKWFRDKALANGFGLRGDGSPPHYGPDENSVATYLSWRWSYLLTSVFFAFAQLFLATPLPGMDSCVLFGYVGSAADEYTSYLEQLPEEVEADFFSPLVNALVAYETWLWILQVVSLVLVLLVGVIYMGRAPSPQVSHVGQGRANPAQSPLARYFRRSKRVMYLAFVLTFAPPFLVVLCFPFRVVVDWDLLVAKVCQSTIVSALNFPGSSLVHRLRLVGTQNLLVDTPLESLGSFVDRTTGDDESEQHVYALKPETIEAWCLEKSTTWHEDFFSTVVNCVWALDEACRNIICMGNNPETSFSLASARPEEFPACLADCLLYAGSNPGVVQQVSPGTTNPAQQWNYEFVRCTTGDQSDLPNAVKDALRSGADAFGARTRMALNMAQQQSKSGSGAAGGVAGMMTVSQQLSVTMSSLFEFGQALHQEAIIALSLSATKASAQAEYVVGLLVGTVTGKELISAAIGLVGGVAEALVNLKALFPEAPLPSWVLLLTVCEALPLYMAFLGVFVQMLGSPRFTLFAVSCCVAVSAAATTGVFTRYLRRGGKGDRTLGEQRERLYSLVLWREYGLRLVASALAVYFLISWSLEEDNSAAAMLDVGGTLRETVLTPEWVAATLLAYFAKKILTAVVTTDLAVGAYVQSEAYNARGGAPEGDPDEAAAHRQLVLELNHLLVGDANP